MLPYFHSEFGNSVSSHEYGWAADQAVEGAREQVAKLFGVPASWVIFTSGATEANNWVLASLASQQFRKDKKVPHIISSRTEHSSVTKTLEHLARNGLAEVTWVPVESTGAVDPAKVEEALRPHTLCVSLMWANNELGTLHPVAELSALAKKHGIVFHSDGTQAVGKIDIDFFASGVSALSFSGHKIYGPKGIGALIVRGREPKLEIEPMFYGGGHERGLRAGTVNVPGVVGLGKACEIAGLHRAANQEAAEKLRHRLINGLKEKFPLQINGAENCRIPQVVSVSFLKHKVPAHLVGIACSRGSACLPTSPVESQGSPVLAAIGLSPELAARSLRLSFGRLTSVDDVDRLILRLANSLQPC